MYSAGPPSADVELTAFRQAEKRYKLYKSSNPKSRKKKQESKETNVSEVVDFRLILETFERTGETGFEGIYTFQCSGFSRPVFCFSDRPGFYFIPSALTVEEQCYWIRESLKTFPQPPNRTNHTAIYGPIHNLLDAVHKHKVLLEAVSLTMDPELQSDCVQKSNVQSSNYVFSEENVNPHMCCSRKAIATSSLLRKLRWSTLGLQFDWSKRNYDPSLPHNKIPDALCLLAKKMAIPAVPLGEEFYPEAAIVNYFGASDMLGGHVDDMEKDWSKPIVSISLGCKAVFLLGGKSRDDSPIAMFLRSGDIVLMAGEARECFHGIPRIFTDDKSSDVEDILQHFSIEEEYCYQDYVRDSRININIRQGWKDIMVQATSLSCDNSILPWACVHTVSITQVGSDLLLYDVGTPYAKAVSANCEEQQHNIVEEIRQKIGKK